MFILKNATIRPEKPLKVLISVYDKPCIYHRGSSYWHINSLHRITDIIIVIFITIIICRVIDALNESHRYSAILRLSK